MQPGDKLDHYEVIEKIGAGGMGEVFRAKDTKLGRDVALKVLPPEFASDPDRLARFRREAKVLAQLHHPNIASIFGLEETPEGVFLVMELVEGEDLSTVMNQGPIPVDDAIDVAKQIAEGLEEAHENGIVHRDLKPANVKRTPDGRVKILDFGLAMALAGESSAEEDSISGMATLTAAMTQAGMILGTAAYMSPEQARGLPVDRRTDIWAFGVILFEMFTGKRLFEGATVTDTLASILKTDPDWDTLPDTLPHQVERVLRRCLTRNARQRLRDIGEARVRLEDPDAESGVFTGPVRPIAMDESSRIRLLPWALLVVAVAALGYFALGRSGSGGGDTGPIQLAVPVPDGVEFQLDTSFPGLPTISPDGRHVVFGCVDEEGEVLLYVRALGSNQAVALDGTGDAQYPFWSPDSRFIAFYDRNEGLKKIPVGGGPGQTICPADNGKGGTWNEDGTIIFTSSFDTPLMRVAAVGGEPVPLTDLETDKGFDSHRHPFFLPDGRRFLYLARSAAGGESEIRLASLDGDSTRVVMKNITQAEYADGYLFYERNGVLLAHAFDPDAVAFTADPVPVASNLVVIDGAARSLYSLSKSGRMVYMRGNALTQDAGLSWISPAGNLIEEIPERDAFDSVVLSPDDRFIALTVLDTRATFRDIWIYEIERGFRNRFTVDDTDEADPLWTPDGRYLYFVADPDGTPKVYRKAVSGIRPPELVFDLGEDVRIWDISADGKQLLYSVTGEGTQHDLWVVELDGIEEPRLLVQTPALDGAARFSPDGKWISYWSMETGTGQIYLAPWPELEWTRRVSTTNGTWQYWLDDSRTMIFQDGAGQVFSSTIEGEGEDVKIGAPVLLFNHNGMQYDGPLIGVTGDGERFVTVGTVATNPPTHFDVIIGWRDLLPRP
jgi:Tol biopolymer transport system component